MRHAIVNVILVLLLAALCSAQAGTTGPAQAAPVIGPQGMTVPQMEARGDELRRLKMYDDALDYYRAAIRIEKKNWILQNKAGIAELQKNNYRAAEKYFDRSIKLHGNYADAVNNMGVAAYLRRDYGKAVRYYKRALALDETNAAFHGNLGTAWFEQKKYDKAMLEYARALELDPELLLRASSSGVSARIASPQERALYSYTLAKLYARAGDVERSLRFLQRAKEFGYPKLRDVYADKEFAVLRDDPRVAQLFAPPVPD